MVQCSVKNFVVGPFWTGTRIDDPECGCVHHCIFRLIQRNEQVRSERYSSAPSFQDLLGEENEPQNLVEHRR
jgi:hypothetical protein